MSALCQAKKLNSGVDLPAVGDTLDLKAAMEDLFGAKMTVTSATLERLSDYTDDNGKTRKLFRILITSTVEADGITRTVGIVHSPVDDENKEYSGTLYTSMNGEVGEGKQGKLASSSMTRMMSIVYAKVAESDGTSRIKAELRTAQVANSLADTAIGSDGVLNFNVGADLSKALTSQDYGKYTGFAQANDAVNAMTYIAFDLNLTSNAGTLSYWKNPGGNYFENARGFNISIERGSDDVLSGCATTGSASTDFTKGTSIRRYLNSAESANSLTLQAKGDWHPFMNSPSSNSSDTDGDFYLRTQQSGQIAKWYKPTLSDSSLANLFATGSDGSYITHQCFKYDSASGLYLIDTDKITETAGYEVLDSGNTVNKSKFIAPPEIGDAKPIDKVEIKK